MGFSEVRKLDSPHIWHVLCRTKIAVMKATGPIEIPWKSQKKTPSTIKKPLLLVILISLLLLPSFLPLWGIPASPPFPIDHCTCQDLSDIPFPGRSFLALPSLTAGSGAPFCCPPGPLAISHEMCAFLCSIRKELWLEHTTESWSENSGQDQGFRQNEVGWKVKQSHT